MNREFLYRSIKSGVLIIFIVSVFATGCQKSDPSVSTILAAYNEGLEYGKLTVMYPENDTLFPPEIIAPRFQWDDSQPKSDTWVVTVKLAGDGEGLSLLTHAKEWRPSEADWDTIKKHSTEENAQITILGLARSTPKKILSRGIVSVGTSKDEVGAPLFYREVNLPFVEAVKDPSNIRWRFGSISTREQPPIVLQHLPVCGNCHSFSADGSVLGMDVDYANDKGSFAIAKTGEDIVLNNETIISWADFRKEDGQLTFGLLSQISPDGRYAVSTVKDRSVFVPKDDLMYSQLFFPLKGILCVYDREKKTYKALPGADDPQYVQSNPAWSPDGRYIVYARSKAYELKSISNTGRILLTQEECEEFLKDGKTFLFDLYRIPFNDGNGGTPAPLPGASNNGMSNFFAKYSPDGKWIVFCKAKSFMLLQPDSELYIIPAEGGEARRLRCNTKQMNSWHSWSPNSRWLVFSSKQNSPYTQLFLTHIDQQGNSTPPVVLSNLTVADRAANIPEFVNLKPDAIKGIREQFVDDVSYVRAAHEFKRAGDYDNAMASLRKALEINPRNPQACFDVAWLLEKSGDVDQAITYYRKSIESDPAGADAYNNLGVLLNKRKDYKEGIASLIKTLELQPNNPQANYNLALANFELKRIDPAIRYAKEAVRLKPDYVEAQTILGVLLMGKDMLKESAECLGKAISLDAKNVVAYYNLGLVMARAGDVNRAGLLFAQVIKLDPNHADAHYDLGRALILSRKIDEGIEYYSKGLKIRPDLVKDPAFFDVLRAAGPTPSQYQQAITAVEKALSRAQTAGDAPLAKGISEQLRIYRQTAPR